MPLGFDEDDAVELERHIVRWEEADGTFGYATIKSDLSWDFTPIELMDEILEILEDWSVTLPGG